jgi:hypothetical protein
VGLYGAGTQFQRRSNELEYAGGGDSASFKVSKQDLAMTEEVIKH